MKKILIASLITLSLTVPSHADEELMNVPQDLNDNLTTGSGNDYSSPTMTAAPTSFKYSQTAAECKNSESAKRASGATEADSATAYYQCLQRTISE